MKVVGDVVCVEIKPKCGFLPAAESIHPGNQIKTRLARFTLHQILKLDKAQCIAYFFNRDLGDHLFSQSLLSIGSILWRG